jgi:hypothetical protein
MKTAAGISPSRSVCHPERNPGVSNGNSRTQSKDPYHADAAAEATGNFRVEIHFYDEAGSEKRPVPSREAAKKCSPRRKPWVEKGN